MPDKNFELEPKEAKLFEAMNSIAVQGIAPYHDRYYEKVLGLSKAQCQRNAKRIKDKFWIREASKGNIEIVPTEERLELQKKAASSTHVINPPPAPTRPELSPEQKKVQNEKNLQHLYHKYRVEIDKFIGQNELEGIRELYYWLDSRGLDAMDYMTDAIITFSKKEKTKRNFPYFVGMIRNWGMNGKWYMPTEEDKLLADIFKELTNLPLSPQATTELRLLISKHGAVKVTHKMTKTLSSKVDADLSLFMVNKVKEALEKEV